MQAGKKHALKLLKKIFLLAAILILHGCSVSYQLVEFESLEPSKVNFPEDVRQLLIINRLPVSFTLLDSSDLSKLSRNQVLGLDTMVSKNVFLGLFELLKLSPLECFHWPIWDTERQSDLMVKHDVRLTKREVIDLCARNSADAIVSLESCSMEIDFKGYYWHGYVLNSPIYQTILKTAWTVYLPQNPRPYHEYASIDSLKDVAFYGKLDFSKMIREVSFKSGYNYGKFITPVWKQTRRKLYVNGETKLRRGGRKTGEGDWEKAFEIWNDLSLSGKSNSRAKALYNMAVYYELGDQLDSASFCLDRALSLDTLSMIGEYHEEIDTRLQKQKILLEQVERARIKMSQ